MNPRNVRRTGLALLAIAALWEYSRNPNGKAGVRLLTAALPLLMELPPPARG